MCGKITNGDIATMRAHTRTGSTGNKINDNPNMVRNGGIHNYFMNQEERTIQSLNARIFIRRKKQQ